VFDLSPFKLVVLAVIALIVFGPHELPKMAQQAGRMLRDLRRIAEGAKADLREGLGPEFQDFDFEDLNPRRFVQRHLLDDMAGASQPLFDEFKSTSDAVLSSSGLNGTGAVGAAAGAAAVNGTRATLLDGQEPPFDMDAT
jgi:sec-independent protein translocase protein TatB